MHTDNEKFKSWLRRNNLTRKIKNIFNQNRNQRLCYCVNGPKGSASSIQRATVATPALISVIISCFPRFLLSPRTLWVMVNKRTFTIFLLLVVNVFHYTYKHNTYTHINAFFQSLYRIKYVSLYWQVLLMTQSALRSIFKWK